MPLRASCNRVSSFAKSDVRPAKCGFSAGSLPRGDQRRPRFMNMHAAVHIADLKRWTMNRAVNQIAGRSIRRRRLSLAHSPPRELTPQFAVVPNKGTANSAKPNAPARRLLSKRCATFRTYIGRTRSTAAATAAEMSLSQLSPADHGRGDAPRALRPDSDREDWRRTCRSKRRVGQLHAGHCRDYGLGTGKRIWPQAREARNRVTSVQLEPHWADFKNGNAGFCYQHKQVAETTHIACGTAIFDVASTVPARLRYDLRTPPVAYTPRT